MNTLLFDKINLSQIKLNTLVCDTITIKDTHAYYSPLTYGDESLSSINIISSSVKLNDIFVINNEQFLDIEFLPQSSSFYKFISDLDMHIINQFVKHSEELVGANVAYNTVNQLYEKSIKLPQNIPALPGLLVKVKPGCVVLSRDNKEIMIGDLCKNNEITIIFNINSVKFFQYKYTLDYQIALIKVDNNFIAGYDCLFNDNKKVESYDEKNEVICANSLDEEHSIDSDEPDEDINKDIEQSGGHLSISDSSDHSDSDDDVTESSSTNNSDPTDDESSDILDNILDIENSMVSSSSNLYD